MMSPWVFLPTQVSAQADVPVISFSAATSADRTDGPFTLGTRIRVGATPDSLKNILVDAQTVSLAARRLEFQNASIAAMSAITARANTVLLHNSSLTVLVQSGMINFYTREGLVNRTYGSGTTSDNGMLNFSGVNSFRIGNNSFTVQDQATLNQHYGNNIVDTQFNGNRPEAGKVNVLKM